MQLSRGVNCLQAGFCSGSYGHLEQPPNAMSWQEEVIQSFLIHACRVCVNLPACQYDLDVHKAWLLASTLEALASMGGVCNHPQGFHKSLLALATNMATIRANRQHNTPKLLQRHLQVSSWLSWYRGTLGSLTDCRWWFDSPLVRE